MKNEMEKRVENLKASHPVKQSSGTGLWGFERVCDCINLNRCVYKSEHSAKIARSKWANEVASIEAAEKDIPKPWDNFKE